MAEYIDKQKYREEWLKFKTFEPMKCLDSIPIVDVVERAEYDKVVQAFKARVDNQRENLIAARSAYFQIEQEDAELRAKIDKTIKEIIEYRDSDKNDFCEVEVGAINGVLEILKRNIEE